jgi:hypothetical protein
MQVQKRTMNWLPRESMYDEAVASRQKRREQNEAFLQTQTNLASTIGSIQQGLISGTGEITSNIAATRLGIDLKA